MAVDADAAPWRAVARVQTEQGRRCTGFLIAPRVALTAAHCLLARDEERFVAPRSVHVLIGYGRGRFAGHARAESFTVPPAYDPGKRVGAASDWAVLVLDAPLGAEGRVLPLAAGLPAVGAPVMLGGYDQDRAEVLTADPDCRVRGLVRAGGSVLICDDCDATRGASGAPLIGRDAAGRFVVYGLLVAAPLHGRGGVAVPAPSVAGTRDLTETGGRRR